MLGTIKTDAKTLLLKPTTDPAVVSARVLIRTKNTKLSELS
jgi:hypothetical protein